MFRVSFFVMLMLSIGALANEPLRIPVFQDEERHHYQVELLQHVLALTEEEYGRAVLGVYRSPDVRDDVALMKGLVDVVPLPTSREREQRFLAVRIPLLQGMLGYRLLVVTAESNTKVSQAQSLEDFKHRLVGGTGMYWEDFRVYNHNKVVTKVVVEYERLYRMLVSSEVDYFTLGASEIFDEVKRQSELYPGLMINSELAFFYPFPMYYFVRLDSAGLAKRIEKGLLKAEADGSFRRIFDKHFQDDINRLKELELNKVFYLANPNIELERPLRYHWWLSNSLIIGSP